MQETRQRKAKKDESLPRALIDDDDYDGKHKYSHSCTWTILKIIFLIFFSLFLILLILPSPIEPLPYRFPGVPRQEGPLAPNKILSRAQRLYENVVLGPESILVEGDHVYTGTADGKILDIYKGEIRVVAKLGKDPCGRFEDEPTCGRPLGIRFDPDGYLIVCDAYLGLHKVNVATGDVHVLWPHTAPIDGKRAKLFNHLVIASDGLMYFTDSSTKWDRRHNRYSIFELETTGRLVMYDPRRNMTTVLVQGLSFPNGLELSRDESFLVMAETAKYKIWRYYLKGDKRGQLQVITDNLPGMPDNIQRSSSGGFWVGFAVVRWKSPVSFCILDALAPYPWIKKLLAKVFPQEVVAKFFGKYGLVIEIDQSGKILRSLHDPTGEVIPTACDVADKDGVLYIGSYYLPFMNKLYLKHASRT